MKIWFTTAEFAALDLPGFPKERKNWDLLAEKNGWEKVPGKSRARKGRGGGVEYHIDLLPPATFAAYVVKMAGRVVVAEEDRVLAEASEPENLRVTAVDNRDARLAVVAAVGRVTRSGGMTQKTADELFCSHYNAGIIEVDAWVRKVVPSVKPRSLRRWRRLKRDGDIGALAVDRGVGRRGSGALDQPDVRAWLLGFIASAPHASAAQVLRNLNAQFSGIDTSISSVTRALRNLKASEKVALARITNPDAWKSKYEPSGENSNAVSRLNELWLIDASPADVLLVDGRYSIYACIDRYSRRTLIYVTKTPRAEAVCLLLRRAFIAWGVPERIKTDNGSDFKARRTAGFLHSLDIEVNVARAYDPKAKAHVERVIKTFQHDCAEELDGYIGHNVGDRKVIEERKSFAQRMGMKDDDIFCPTLTAKEFQKICDHWAGVRYEHRAHGGKDMGKKSPWQKAADYVGSIKRIENDQALGLLLAPIAGGDGTRVTTKLGVRVDNAQYHTATVLPGERVFVRMDPADMGRIYLFAPDGLTYLGDGICPELAGVDPIKLQAQVKKAQAELLAERTTPMRQELRQIKKDKPARAAEIARQEAEAAGKLVMLPRRTETYTTPALEAASEALASPAPDQVVVDNSLAVLAGPARIVVLPETKEQRFKRALALEADQQAGIRISIDDERWLLGYQPTAECRSMRAFYQDFGEAALR